MFLKEPRINIFDLENILLNLKKSEKIELIGTKDFIVPSFWAILRCEQLRRKLRGNSLKIL